jgi:prepilin peptidase CpaA
MIRGRRKGGAAPSREPEPTLMPESSYHVVLIVAVVVTAIAAVYDMRSGQIPSWLTTPALLAAPIFHFARYAIAHQGMESSLQEAGYSLLGAAVCSVVPLILFRQSAMGGGDVKLLAALGAILQTRVGVEAQMCGFFAGALLAPAKLAYEGKLFATLKNAFAIGLNLFLPKTRQRSIEESALSWFRLGPAIFLGTLLTAYLYW